MNRKKEPVQGHSLKVAMIFFLGVVSVIAISLAAKSVAVIKASVYDGTHQFVIAASDASDTARLYGFDRDAKTLSVLTILHNPKGTPPNKNAAVIADASVQVPHLPATQNASEFLSYVLWHLGSVRKNLTGFDLIRLFLFAKTMPNGYSKIESLTFPNDDQVTDKMSQELFSDPTIEKEDVTIEVTNATDATGIGTRVERVLSNMGGNVIAVTSARDVTDTTTIQYYGDESYTVQKIARFLHVVPKLTQTKMLSDILIVIGKKSLSDSSF